MDQSYQSIERQYLTVTALTKYIKVKLEGDKHLISILIKGEISNYKRHSRGHLYFTLKDENAAISAIMFSKDTERLLFSPKEGDHVLIQGRISVYEPSGTYSIQVAKMTLDGVGELYQKYEQLKKELEEKGYFRLEHKKKVPSYPKVIGVVTSPTGAVIQDIINTVTRRYPLAEVHLYPALVQGPGSADSLRNQIIYANTRKEVDVLIVGRGGGSIEDLWSFNEMPVIEAIYQSEIPIITAIGHETDFTISDFVSDLRAPTPTAAAELATPNKQDLFKKIDEYQEAIAFRINQLFLDKKTSLVYLDERLDRLSPTNKLTQLKDSLRDLDEKLVKHMTYNLEMKHIRIDRQLDLMKSPVDKLNAYKQTQAHLTEKLHQSIALVLQLKKSAFDLERKTLTSLNPLHVMDRGFALVTKDDHVITSVRDVKVNDDINLRFKDGYVDAVIKGKKEN